MKLRLRILILAMIVGPMSPAPARAQHGHGNFGKEWVQGAGVLFKTRFERGLPPVNEVLANTIDPFLDGGHSSVCDSSGNLVLFTDGYRIYDRNVRYIDNSDFLTPLRILAFHRYSNPNTQGAMILPFANGIYRMFTATVSDDSCFFNWERNGNGQYCDMLIYHEIDMNANAGAGRVTKRSVPLLQSARLSKGHMMACRHGNGKDWWLIKQAAEKNRFHIFLATQDSILGPWTQTFGTLAGATATEAWGGQLMFSPDGRQFASTESFRGRVLIGDFDRSSGTLSNLQEYKVPPRPAVLSPDPPTLDSVLTGVCFSPSGRLLYVTSLHNIQQLDLSQAQSGNGWTHLSGADTDYVNFQHYKSVCPGPDGRLYIGNSSNNTATMHTIDVPDNAGAACGFCKRCFVFPPVMRDTALYGAWVTTPPNVPDYHLGALNPGGNPTGVRYRTAADRFSLTPNPSPGIIQLTTGTNGIFTLHDATGKEVLRVALPQGKAELDLRRLRSGVYFFRLQNAAGEIRAGKLLINTQ